MSTTHKRSASGNAPARQSSGMSDTLSDYVSTKKAAELLGVADSQVRRLLIDGKLKGMKPGHEWIVYRPSLEQYFKSKAASGRPSSSEPQLKS